MSIYYEHACYVFSSAGRMAMSYSFYIEHLAYRQILGTLDLITRS